jgi:hypothetical protein
VLLHLHLHLHRAGHGTGPQSRVVLQFGGGTIGHPRRLLRVGEAADAADS